MRVKLLFVAAVVAVLSVSACGGGGDDEEEATTQATTDGYCYVRKHRIYRESESVFVLYAPGRAADDGTCSSFETVRVIDDCVTKLKAGSLLAPGAVDELADCLKQTKPDATLVSDLTGGSARELPAQLGLLAADLSLPVDNSSCSTIVNPREALAQSGGRAAPKGQGEKAVEVAKVIGVSIPLAELLRQRREEMEKTPGSSDESIATIQDDAKHQKLQSDLTSLSIAAEAMTEKPVLTKVWEWLTSPFRSDAKTTPNSDVPVTNSTSPAGQPDDEAMDPCTEMALAAWNCALAEWGGPGCGGALDSLRTPGCDPERVNPLPDQAPCPTIEPTEEEITAAIAFARIKCWSVVQPEGPVTDVCGMLTSHGTTLFATRASGDVCSRPEALVSEDQCLIPTAPEDLSKEIGTHNNIFNVLMGLYGAPPPLPPRPLRSEPGARVP